MKILIIRHGDPDYSIDSLSQGKVSAVLPAFFNVAEAVSCALPKGET